MPRPGGAQPPPSPNASIPPVDLLPSFQRRVRVEIRFLRIDTPVAQVFQRDLPLGDGAHDKAARLENLEVRIEKSELGLARQGAGCERIHGPYMPTIRGKVKAAAELDFGVPGTGLDADL